ncbi:MAG: choice-of-anchor D domain-containing protein [Pseudomonadota bacterium]
MSSNVWASAARWVRVASGLLVAMIALSAPSVMAQTETLTYAGEVDDATGAFVALTPVGTIVGGPIVVDEAALLAGSIGIADIVSIDVNVGGFCFATGMGDCGGVGTLVPITSIDAAAITGSAGTLAGNFTVTAFSPTFMVSIPISFDLDAASFSADGGALGTVGGFGSLTSPLAAAPEIDTTPAAGAAAIDFGDVATGSGAQAQTIMVSNTGTGPLTISSVTTTGAPGDLVVTNTCDAAPIAAGGMCEVTATLTPTIEAAISANISIASDDADESVLDFGVLANVVAPAALSSDAPIGMALMIDSVAVGGTTTGVVTVTNTGGLAATLGTATMPGAPFALTAQDLCSGQVLAPAGMCTIEVEFSPTASGAFDSTFSIDLATPGAGTNADIAVMSSTLDPAVMASADPILIGDTIVGDTNTEVLTLTNTGDADLLVSAVTGLAAPFSVAADTCTGTPVAPMAMCMITIEFAPTVEAAVMDIIEIASNDPASPLNIDVSANGTAMLLPNINVAPLAIDFAPAVLLGTSETETVTVSNLGTADLNITSITVSAGSADFTIMNNCGAMLATAASCTVDVTYTPSAAGNAMATLSIVSDDPDTPTADVALSGSGVAPAPEIDVSATALMFGSILANATATLDLTVSNTGTADLVISGVTIGGADSGVFAQTNDCATVTAGGNCVVSVTFDPMMVIDATATLTIASNDADEAMLDVALTGMATPVPEPMIVVPAGLDIGGVNAGTTGTGTITVENMGTADLVISSVMLNGTSTDFAQTNACGTVAPSATCDIELTFTPATPGAATIDVVIDSNDADNPTSTVPVTAEALIAVAQISNTAFNFGSVRIGETGTNTVMITNAGNIDLMVTGATLGGTDAASYSLANACATLAAGASCTIDITYTPAAEGASMATLTITTSDLALPTADVALSAAGAPREPVVVTVSTEGGSGGVGSLGWLSLAGVLLAVARRLRLGALMLALGLSAAAMADDHDASYWYAGVAFGGADGQADVAAIRSGIEEAVNVESIDIGDDDTGFKGFVGFQATEHLGVELGYVDLGEADIDLQLGDVTLETLPLISRTVSGNLSLLGSGVFGSVVARQSIGEHLGVMARVGLISWEVETTIGGSTSTGALNIEEVESGTDFTFGIGVEGWFGENKRFGVRGEWERFELGEQDAEFLSLGILYRF